MCETEQMARRMRDLREKLSDYSGDQATLAAKDKRKFYTLKGNIREIMAACKSTMANTDKMLLSYFRGLRSEDLSREVHKKFQASDTNADGILEFEEVKGALEEMGLRTGEEELESLFTAYDAEEGEIQEKDFENIVFVRLGRRCLPNRGCQGNSELVDTSTSSAADRSG
mmetsp:Transcript_21981/g.44245  ORF Transcript_21981/g.44245 Transcript_21981/m.44245 type:complete len:170 (-) Transcript_21981:130-639(-)